MIRSVEHLHHVCGKWDSRRVLESPRSLHKATLIALSSSVLFAIMAMIAREVAFTIPGPQVALVRFTTGVLVTLAAWAMFPISLRPQRWGWLVARGIFGGLAVLLYFTSIEKVGVGVATLLNYTAPVWSLVFAWILLGEKPKLRAILALVLTLIGVFLVATGRGHRLTWGTWEVVAIFSAAVSGMAITSIRATRRPSTDGTPSETNWTVFASFTLVGSLVTLPTVFPPLGTWIAPNLGQWMLLILCALFSVAAQLLMTSALREITAAGIGIIHQLTVVITLLGGWVFFRETLSPRALVGSVVTISGVLWLVLSDR